MLRLFKRYANTALLLIILMLFVKCDSNDGNYTSEKEINIEELTIKEVQDAYKNGEYTIEQLTKEYIERIERIDANGPMLNSIIEVNPDAIIIAKQLDKEMSEGKIRGPMHGIPVVIKDNINTGDKMHTTAGSLALKNSIAPSDSYIVKKLRNAGAVIIGKTNLSEWANFRGELSSSGWSGVGGQTKNPYVLDRNPCGSSSGSGVAASANLCLVAIGTETNGSIVCPSTTNGIVGIKPTVGLLSRSGIIPISSTQDTPGPMARTLTDAAICLGTMIGVDSLDNATLSSYGNSHTDYSKYLVNDGLSGVRIGYYTKAKGVNYKVDDLMNKAINDLKKLGAEIIEVDHIYDPIIEQYSFDIMLYEYKDGLNNYFSSLGPKSPIKNLDELIEFNKNTPEELEFYNQKYLEMANEMGELNSPEYAKLIQLIKMGITENGIDKVMDSLSLDAFIAPTGSPAWKTDHTNGDSYVLGSSSPAAISGYPNITVPMGMIDELPVGISFFGKAWSEPKLIEIAYNYEQSTQHRSVPKFLKTN